VTSLVAAEMPSQEALLVSSLLFAIFLLNVVCGQSMKWEYHHGKA
jgi:hypothetical protein